jgi:hypothetical protein
MDSTRSVSTDRLRRDIDTTRASITGTVGELRQKVGESMQWQTYVERHPTPLLVGAAVVGLLVGRRLARRFAGDGQKWTVGGESNPAAPVLSSARFVTVTPDRLGAVTASWQRLGSRVEALANRVIDEVAEAAERIVVPALVHGVETLLEGRRPNAGTTTGPRVAAP